MAHVAASNCRLDYSYWNRLGEGHEGLGLIRLPLRALECFNHQKPRHSITPRYILIVQGAGGSYHFPGFKGFSEEGCESDWSASQAPFTGAILASYQDDIP